MLIRSQDKKEIINLDNVTKICTYEGEIVACFNSNGEDYTVIGIYSTEEKVIKVLDKIQHAYFSFNNIPFQMPKDSGVDLGD